MADRERTNDLFVNIGERDYYEALALVAQLPPDVGTPILRLLGKYDRERLQTAPEKVAAGEKPKTTALAFTFGGSTYEAPIGELYEKCYMQDGVIKLPDEAETRVWVTTWRMASGDCDYTIGSIAEVVRWDDPELPLGLVKSDIIVQATLRDGQSPST